MKKTEGWKAYKVVPIKDLTIGGKRDVVGEVIQMEPPQEVVVHGHLTRVANGVIRDKTGTVSISLWGNDIAKVKMGDTIRFRDAWVTEYMDRLQVSRGAYGKLEVVKRKKR